MDVILHFGAHRTATTTFQRMMGRSGDALRATGRAYWGPKRTRSTLFDGLLGPAAGIMPWVSRRGHRAAGRVQLAMSELEEQGASSLLISEENMVGTLRQTLATGKLYPDAHGRGARLGSVFGENCVRIGVGIRSYDAWWTSAIAFSVAKAGPVPGPALTETVIAQPRRWRDVITDLADVFPAAEVVVWTHEVMAARPELVAKALIGPDLPRLRGTRDWHNAAPTPAAMRGYLSDLGQPTDGVIEKEGRFQPFAPQDRRVLQAHYADDIAWLRAGEDERITYIDDLGTDPGATGHGEGQANEGRGFEDRRMA